MSAYRHAATLFALPLLLAPALAVAADCDPGEVKIRFSHVTAVKGHPKGEAAQALAERINAELNGRACMEVYPNSTLFKDDDALFQGLLDGEVEMAAPSIAKMSDLSKKFQLFDLPFLFASMESAIDFQYGPEAEALLHAAEDKGFVGLAYWMNGMREFSATRPILAPGDLKGLKIRAEGSPVELTYFKMLGAEPKKLAFSAVHDALASGEVDGQANTWSNIYTKKFFQVQDGTTQTDHSLLAYIVVTSKRFMDSLDPQLRADLEMILLETTHERNRFAQQLAEVNEQKVQENGGKVRRLTEAQRAAWVAAMKPVWAQFEGEIGADLIRAAEASNKPGF